MYGGVIHCRGSNISMLYSSTMIKPFWGVFDRAEMTIYCFFILGFSVYFRRLDRHRIDAGY